MEGQGDLVGKAAPQLTPAEQEALTSLPQPCLQKDCHGSAPSRRTGSALQQQAASHNEGIL